LTALLTRRRFWIASAVLALNLVVGTTTAIACTAPVGPHSAVATAKMPMPCSPTSTGTWESRIFREAASKSGTAGDRPGGEFLKPGQRQRVYPLVGQLREQGILVTLGTYGTPTSRCSEAIWSAAATSRTLKIASSTFSFTSRASAARAGEPPPCPPPSREHCINLTG
jgi:hypothetical protein